MGKAPVARSVSVPRLRSRRRCERRSPPVRAPAAATSRPDSRALQLKRPISGTTAAHTGCPGRTCCAAYLPQGCTVKSFCSIAPLSLDGSASTGRGVGQPASRRMRRLRNLRVPRPRRPGRIFTPATACTGGSSIDPVTSPSTAGATASPREPGSSTHVETPHPDPLAAVTSTPHPAPPLAAETGTRSQAPRSRRGVAATLLSGTHGVTAFGGVAVRSGQRTSDIAASRSASSTSGRGCQTRATTTQEPQHGSRSGRRVGRNGRRQGSETP
jgi:hypothetical protein